MSTPRYRCCQKPPETWACCLRPNLHAVSRLAPATIWLWIGWLWIGLVWIAPAAGQTLTLEQSLSQIAASELATQALSIGDPQRGALLFHQSHLACLSCHASDSASPATALGPNLAQWPERLSDAEIVDSLLRPSAKIRSGYHQVTLLDADGRMHIGRVHSQDDTEIVLLTTPANNPNPTPVQKIFLKADVEIQTGAPVSPMPTGLVNQLSNRQQFLDLVRYLMELQAGGEAAQRRLKPPAHLLVTAAVADYESQIDHAGLIRALDPAAFDRGEAIYQRMCINCHGTVEAPGSLPTSLRFADGQFKNGNSPFAMYQTVTRGYGMMQGQPWMVPQQKYDVIHYIRQTFLQPHNPTQYFEVNDTWLATLPAGDSLGPAPSEVLPWAIADYGPTLINTYEIGDDESNFAHKGIALRLDSGAGGVSRGRHWMVFDHDTLRMAAAWSGEGFINWEGIHFDGRHNAHPRIEGQLAIENKTGPGWAHPDSQSWQDDRVIGRDQRHYGPLPKSWGHFQGLHRNGKFTLLDYRVGQRQIYEEPQLIDLADRPVFVRRFQVGPGRQAIRLAVGQIPPTTPHRPASQPEASAPTADAQLQKWQQAQGTTAYWSSTSMADANIPADESAGILAGVFCFDATSAFSEAAWQQQQDTLVLEIPASESAQNFVLWFTRSPVAAKQQVSDRAMVQAQQFGALNVDFFTRADAALANDLNQKIDTQVQSESAEDHVSAGQAARSPFAVDVLTWPEQNPWSMQMRFTGLDFFSNGDAMAITTWDGDVWRVTGVLREDGKLTWQRIASGLFQPLGVKIVDDQIYVTCRDQIVRLHDRNQDGVTDWYENFNSDHQVTPHFHEFAMGLQQDDAGNFYYAKSARHALPAVVPHHGTLLKVSADGKKTEIIANGFRAANGVCLNPDGSFIVTDQEGHWNPKNRINWVTPGGFYGNMFGYHAVTDPADSAMEQPICWITNDFDRSPAELVWVPENTWGPLAGSLLNLSYGYGKIYVVPFEKVAGQPNAPLQGGMCELPVAQFPTGLIRGRFHPQTGDFYTCGMFAWAGNQQQSGGLYRVRYLDQAMHVPLDLRVRPDGIEFRLSEAVDRQSAEDIENYSVEAWDLDRTENYGSPHINQRSWKITAATLADDGNTIRLTIPEIAPTAGMEIRFELETRDGKSIERSIHNSIHVVPNQTSIRKPKS